MNENIIQPYLDNLKLSNKSEHTIRGYKKDILKFLNFFEIDKLEDTGKIKQADYIRFVSSLELSPNSINALIRNISAFHTWLFDNGHIQENNFSKVKFGKSRFVKVEKKVKPILTDDEIVKIITNEKNIQKKFMFGLMVMTGLRRDEVSKIKISDIHNNVITVNGKGSKQRNIFLNDYLMGLMNEYLAGRKNKSEFLFEHGGKKIDGVSINLRVKEMIRKNGIDKDITAHRLRATAITKVIRSAGIHAAQRVAGHSSILTTKIYDASGEEVVENALMNLTVKGLE